MKERQKRLKRFWILIPNLIMIYYVDLLEASAIAERVYVYVMYVHRECRRSLHCRTLAFDLNGRTAGLGLAEPGPDPSLNTRLTLSPVFLHRLPPCSSGPNLLRSTQPTPGAPLVVHSLPLPFAPESCYDSLAIVLAQLQTLDYSCQFGRRGP